MTRNILIGLVLVWALVACDNQVATPEMQKADDAAGRAGSAAKEAAGHAADAAKHAGTALKEEVKDAMQDNTVEIRNDRQP
ncbi:MAG TPA: hypothetical protein VJU83_01630 [Burkholderiales bacterium]|nr:hypothetical protein [Burkholderiales bacterium]